ncbi:LysR substrate-binding domain-containing protein [Chitinasiproducens palmae]|uniref:DNA-binding transcriptional regulator, LysR family n=1 Tax=Chitinasiproducens palmae TaxID=1770053 RepID=A0A1H2PLA0_9BURK|nr:LysR substrate-binding domain-containing protein [Chitinasiproducens palmae]SDV47152.1 DNA-binding transcriptional regulator, LysR family [Chitinasiproducens palmae]
MHDDSSPQAANRPPPLPSHQPPTFDLELLRTFLAVVSYGTFTAAARHLKRTQSAVTQQMYRLEEQVGSALFLKAGRSKRLSPRGQQLLHYAKEILSLNDDAMWSLRQGAGHGLLRIGSPHDVAETLLPSVLGRLRRSLPEVSSEIHIGRSPELMAALNEGRLDMVISSREDDALEGFALSTLPTVWLCAAHFVPAIGEPVPLIVGDTASIFFRFALDALDRAKMAWRPACTSSSPLGVKAAIRAGLGVAARSTHLLGPDMRVLGAPDGFPKLPDITYFLWIRPHVANTLAQQAFELLRANQPARGGARRGAPASSRRQQSRLREP